MCLFCLFAFSHTFFQADDVRYWYHCCALVSIVGRIRRCQRLQGGRAVMAFVVVRIVLYSLETGRTIEASGISIFALSVDCFSLGILKTASTPLDLSCVIYPTVV